MVAIELATAGGLSALVSNRAYRPTQLNQVSISFALLVLPASALLISLGQAILATLLAAVTAVTVYALAGTAAKAVLLAGLAIGLLLYRARPVVARVALAISMVAIIAAPLTFARLERLPGVGETADGFKISAGHRMLIWSFAGDRIAERPLTGWGLDASRAIPGGDDPIRPGETWMPLHPHNAALQVWLELGAPGAVLFAVLAALVWGALAGVEWPPLFAAAAGASLTIAFVGCCATYGIWQEWWLGTLSFSLFLVLVMGRVAGCPAVPGRRGGLGDFLVGAAPHYKVRRAQRVRCAHRSGHAARGDATHGAVGPLARAQQARPGGRRVRAHRRSGSLVQAARAHSGPAARRVVRLCVHRLPALARHPDGQRALCGRPGDRADAVRVLRARGAHFAHGHHRSRAGDERAPRGRGDRADERRVDQTRRARPAWRSSSTCSGSAPGTSSASASTRRSHPSGPAADGAGRSADYASTAARRSSVSGSSDRTRQRGARGRRLRLGASAWSRAAAKIAAVSGSM